MNLAPQWHDHSTSVVSNVTPNRASSKLLYYDRADVSKGTLVDGTQFGDLKLRNIQISTVMSTQEPSASCCTCITIALVFPKEPWLMEHSLDTYSEKRFKQTLRVSRGSFQFILNRISHDLHVERD